MIKSQTYIGNPCKRGGHTERYIKGGHCFVCANIDKKKHYIENRERYLAKQKKWRAENPEKSKTYNKKWNAENIEKKKTYYKKWIAENSEKKKAYDKKYKKENLKQYAYNQAKRRAMKKQQTPPWADLEKIKQIYINCPEGYEVDHKHPLSKGGLHVDYNLQSIPISENRSKGAKLDYDTTRF